MTERIESLDTLKGLALFAVVIIHIRGEFIGRELIPGILDFIILNSSRIGVPLFFLISGFLLKKKFEQRDTKKYTVNYVKNLIYYYILANGLYLSLQTGLILIQSYTSISLPRTVSMTSSLTGLIFDFFYTGYAVRMSLWFFTALIFSTLIIYLANKYRKINTLLLIASLLHFIGVAVNSYQFFDLPIPPRDALFFGLVYTSVGFKIAELKLEKIRNHRSKLIWISGLLLLLHLAERVLITDIVDVKPFFWQDYSFLTLPLTTSLFLLGLSIPNLGAETRLNTYGKYTLLGYIFHQIVGAILTGLTIGIGAVSGTSPLQNSIINLVLVILTYIFTMEAVLKYRER